MYMLYISIRFLLFQGRYLVRLFFFFTLPKTSNGVLVVEWGVGGGFPVAQL